MFFRGGMWDIFGTISTILLYTRICKEYIIEALWCLYLMKLHNEWIISWKGPLLPQRVWLHEMENVIGAGRKISIKIGPNEIYNSWGAVEAESSNSCRMHWPADQYCKQKNLPSNGWISCLYSTSQLIKLWASERNHIYYCSIDS